MEHYTTPARPDLAALREVTSEVRHTTSQLTGLLDNLLHWATNQSGTLRYHPEALDAATLLHELAALYGRPAQDRQLTLAVAAAPILPSLWADRNMVLTQLRNLLSNALRMAPANSTVTLAAQLASGGMELSVTDAGPGLSAAQLALLASYPSQQLPPRLPGQQGTGLGLWLVRQLAGRQHGTFQLDSAPGQGVVARLWLPLSNG